MPTSASVMPSIDPQPVDFIHKENIDELIASIRHIHGILSQSGLMRPYLRYFVRRYIAVFVLADQPSIYPTDDHVSKWIEQNSTSHNDLSLQDARFKLAVQPACLYWARKQWGHLLGSLYLSQKSDLDQASCLLLRVKDKSLVTELFYRIKNQESTFRSISFEFGEGPEARQGGLISLTPLSKMPFGLAKVIPTLNKDVLSGPYRHGNFYSLIQLIEFRPCELDSSTEDFLLSHQLASWTENAVNYLYQCVLDAQPSDHPLPRP